MIMYLFFFFFRNCYNNAIAVYGQTILKATCRFNVPTSVGLDKKKKNKTKRYLFMIPSLCVGFHRRILNYRGTIIVPVMSKRDVIARARNFYAFPLLLSSFILKYRVDTNSFNHTYNSTILKIRCYVLLNSRVFAY